VKSVFIKTLGCRLNQAESEHLELSLAEKGYSPSSSPFTAEILILNTCTVTHIADRKSRRFLRWMRKVNPGAKVLVTGCYARRDPKVLSMLADAVLPYEEDILKVLKPEKERNDFVLTRPRSLIKAQEGCNHFCSFCIVPYVRGRERIIAPGEVIAEISHRVRLGYKEVTLTGTNIGSYPELSRLVYDILQETNIDRIRLSSLKPQDITPGLLDLFCDQRVCPHFHLPLQSGSDDTLLRMKREYSTAQYRKAVSLIRERLPHAAITADIIVGFPQEREEEFAESLEFCREMNFARIHTFPFSPRGGTAAYHLPQVGDKVKRGRAKIMSQLSEESQTQFRKIFLGQIRAVLWEEKVGRVWSGLTDNYLRVFTHAGQDLRGKFSNTVLLREVGGGIWGEIAS
jgi:threonylcarbamoyladenosine tRNA methylthiotransferase MtaB